MNGAQAHLLLNHLPVFGIAFGLLILLYAIYRKSEEMKIVAMGLFVITALGTIPAYLTGEPAEDVVEEMAEVSKNAIKEHEESATASLVGIEALGVISLLGLFLARKKGISAPAMLVNGIVLLALASFAMVAWTSHLGGQVHHPELRGGSQLQFQDEGGGKGAGGTEERRGRSEPEEREEGDAD